MSFNFDNKNIIKNMYKGSFGIEKESLRVQKDGFLAHSAHPVGIFNEDMDFLHMLILYLTSLEDGAFTESEQICAIKNVKQAAKYDDENTFIDFGGENFSVKSAVYNMLCDMQKFFEKYNQDNALNIIDYQMNKITDKNKRYVEIIRNNFSNNYVENGIRLSLKYADRSD